MRGEAQKRTRRLSKSPKRKHAKRKPDETRLYELATSIENRHGTESSTSIKTDFSTPDVVTDHSRWDTSIASGLQEIRQHSDEKMTTDGTRRIISLADCRTTVENNGNLMKVHGETDRENLRRYSSSEGELVIIEDPELPSLSHEQNLKKTEINGTNAQKKFLTSTSQPDNETKKNKLTNGVEANGIVSGATRTLKDDFDHMDDAVQWFISQADASVTNPNAQKRHGGASVRG